MAMVKDEPAHLQLAPLPSSDSSNSSSTQTIMKGVKSKDVDRSLRDTRLKILRDPSHKLLANKGMISLFFCLFCVLFAPRLGLEGGGSLLKGSSSTMNTNVHKTCPHNYQKHGGLIVSNLQGRIGNNILEIGFANLLAKETCWPVVYRVAWKPTFPSPRSKECFPHAMMPMIEQLDDVMLQDVKKSLDINQTMWNDITFDEWNGDAAPAKNSYNEWVRQLGSDNKVWRCEHLECDFRGGTFIQDTVASLRPSQQLLSLSAFFVHYDWIEHHLQEMRQWFQIRPSCCQHHPPEDAVVIHFRNFAEGDHGIKNVPWNVSVYESIFDQYGYRGRPVWVVCEPRTLEYPSALLDALKDKLQAQIYTGVDEFDAHCILQQAKVLILSTSSTFSQTAALLSHHPDTVQVHYPTYGFHHPKVTLKVPGWKYHLVDRPHESAKHKIVDFDMNHSKIVVRFADP